MSFAFYANEEMTIQAAKIIEHQFNLTQPKAYVLKMWFGSRDTTVKLVTEENGGLNNITLMPESVLPEWVANKAYVAGDVVLSNGTIHQCVQAGTSGASVPIFLATVGAVVTDGGCVWKALGKAYAPSDMRLSLSESGLQSAVGGAALSLGAEVLGGAAIAVYVQINSSVQTPYLLAGTPQIGIAINRCFIVPV